MVVKISIELETDKIMVGNPCPEGCRLCVDACPVKAVGNLELNQMACWEYAFGSENGGDFKIKCYKCREVCPNCLGMKKLS